MIDTRVPSRTERLKRHLLFSLHRVVRGFGNRLLDEKYLHPRPFSNMLLKQYAPLFKGSVINVSGWNDTDREGGTYRSYFTKHTAYTVSNYETRQRGVGSMAGTGVREIPLDLNKPLPTELEKKFDVVFNHTTLEHIIHVEQAFENLCALSRDAVILVVPVIQNFHIVESYGDYWRMMLFAVAKLFKRHGFTTLVLKVNEQPFAPIYCFAIGVRDPKKYEGMISEDIELDVGARLYGSAAKSKFFKQLLEQSDT